MRVNDVKEFTVIRNRWVRGAGGGDEAGDETHLANRHGLCCLGFLGLACGLSEKQMEEIGTPAAFINENPFIPYVWPEKLTRTLCAFPPLAENSEICTQIININDSTEISESARENSLIKEFASIGIKVNFVD